MECVHQSHNCLFGVNYKTWNIPLIIVDDAHIDVQASE